MRIVAYMSVLWRHEVVFPRFASRNIRSVRSRLTTSFPSISPERKRANLLWERKELAGCTKAPFQEAKLINYESIDTPSILNGISWEPVTLHPRRSTLVDLDFFGTYTDNRKVGHSGWLNLEPNDIYHSWTIPYLGLLPPTGEVSPVSRWPWG